MRHFKVSHICIFPSDGTNRIRFTGQGMHAQSQPNASGPPKTYLLAIDLLYPSDSICQEKRKLAVWHGPKNVSFPFSFSWLPELWQSEGSCRSNGHPARLPEKFHFHPGCHRKHGPQHCVHWDQIAPPPDQRTLPPFPRISFPSFPGLRRQKVW